MAESKNSSGDPSSVCGYGFPGPSGDALPAERVAPCAVCRRMTFASFSRSNTVYLYRTAKGGRVVLCAHCANDSLAYSLAEDQFGPLEYGE